MIDGFHVIDGHAHLGRSSISGVDNTEDALLRGMDSNGVDVAMVLPHAFQDLEVAGVHDRIAVLARKEKNRIYGIASLSPRLPEEQYRREAERCVRGMGFKALKLDPNIAALPIGHKRCEVMFACAREFGVPVLIHTGPGGYCNPTQTIAYAQQYTDVTIVLSHAGMLACTGEAIVTAKLCPNVILEHSWCMSLSVGGMVRQLGSSRVMFGSDHITNIASELAKVRALSFDDTQLRDVLGGTAARVFGVPAGVA